MSATTLTPQQAWPFPVADAPTAQGHEHDGMNSPPVEAPTPAFVTPPAIGQYWPGQGGVYMGVRPAIGNLPAGHMVYSDEMSEPLAYGKYKRIPGADSAHDGRANTDALIAAAADNDGSPAAAWAHGYTKDGHADFVLPSQADLVMAYLHARAADSQVFGTDVLWSSTQGSADVAFAQDFEYGFSGWGDKDGKFRVRALRLIQL
ncbi:hypothetical protein P3G55_20875 [Leptospira sp. 96542]|nr:hypothetical protein [Leptospira sp. 96542]